MSMGRYRDAIADLDAAIKIVPDNYQYYLAKSEAYEKMGDFQSAMKCIEDAEKLLPDPSLLNDRKKEISSKMN